MPLNDILIYLRAPTCLWRQRYFKSCINFSYSYPVNFHGAEDAAVDPLNSLDMMEALKKAGAHPGFTQYPEAGHSSWLGAYSDPQVLERLFWQHKQAVFTQQFDNKLL
jgi:hypothetical protein